MRRNRGGQEDTGGLGATRPPSRRVDWGHRGAAAGPCLAARPATWGAAMGVVPPCRPCPWGRQHGGWVWTAALPDLSMASCPQRRCVWHKWEPPTAARWEERAVAIWVEGRGGRQEGRGRRMRGSTFPKERLGRCRDRLRGPHWNHCQEGAPATLPPRHWGGWSGSWGWSAEPPPSGPRRTRRRSWRFGCCPCCTFTAPAARPRTGASHGGEKWAEKGAGGGHGRELPPHTPIPYCEGLTAAARRAVGMPGTLSPTSMTHYLIS